MQTQYQSGQMSPRGNRTLDVLVDGEVIATIEAIEYRQQIGGCWNGVNYATMERAVEVAVAEHQKAAMAWVMNTDLAAELVK